MTDKSATTQEPARQEPKQPYSTPTLRKYGDVTTITQGSNSNAGDSGAASA